MTDWAGYQTYLTYQTCSEGTGWAAEAGACKPYRDRWHFKPAPVLPSCQAGAAPPPNPGYGNPIYPLSGNRRQSEVLGEWLGQRVAITYDTLRKLPSNAPLLVFAPKPAASFGPLWESSLHKQLVVQSGTREGVQAGRGGNAWISFASDGNGNYNADADIADRLYKTASGWRYVDSRAQAEEIYDANGRLLTISYASGLQLAYSYSDSSTPLTIAPVPGLLIKVQDQLGRSVQFNYQQPADPDALPRITRLIDPAGQFFDFGYDSYGNLAQIKWPDTQLRTYLYENTGLPWALTGIKDENSRRLSTYGYDTLGRANETQYAGNADHYSVSYTSAPAGQVAETYDAIEGVIWRDHYLSVPQGVALIKPTGQSVNLVADSVLGMPRLTSQSQPAGAGCTASTSTQAYDAAGNITQRDDFNGHRACYAYDGSNRQTARVEGLSNTATCSTYIANNAVLPAGTRKTSTQWHPDWRQATKVAEPGRITTFVYNGQPDPFNSNAAASCAPATATLPDGKPIAVLCKQVEQSTTDTDGHLGFSAALQTGVASRVQQWTYNQYGQVLTATDPLLHKTTYAYYADTTADHTMGDLQSVTNALNQVTKYTKYNPHGQVLQMVDANNITTDYQYDQRQRLTRVTTAGHITRYDYWPTGLLKQVTQPDASYITYSYDDAHRLTDIADNLGNSVHYTLDNSGNRTKEEIKDNAGTLRAQMNRTYDALNRVQQTRIGRE